MSLIDEQWLRQLMQQVQAGQQTDPKAPMSAGLMAAGLGMLANAHKGFAGGVGEGGLLGLNAYQQAMQAQRKDPAQQLTMANAIIGMQEKLQDQKMWEGFRTDMGGMTQQSPVQPAYGMQDRSLGEMPPPPPQGQQQAGKPSLEVLEKYMTKPKTASVVGPLIKHYYPDLNLVPGAVHMRGGEVTASNPDLTKPVMGPDGRVAYRPGLVEDEARKEALIAQARQRAQARYTPVQTTRDGRPELVTAEEFAAARSAPAKADEPPPDILAAMQEMQKNRIPSRWDQTTGLQVGDAARNYQAPGRLGVGQTEAEKAAALLPGKLAEERALIEVAKEKQGALLPGEMKKSLISDAYKTQLSDLKESYKSANTAKEVLMAVNESRESLASPVIVGGFGKTKIAGLNAINGVLPAGLQIAPALLSNSQRLASSLGQQLVKHAKDLGFNPSNADAKRLEKVIGDEGLSEKGIRAMLDFQEKMARQSIDQHNKIAGQAEEKGGSPLFDYKVAAPEVYGGTKPKLAPIVPGREQPSAPTTNMTARVAAQQILKHPDATPADIARAKRLLGVQ